MIEFSLEMFYDTNEMQDLAFPIVLVLSSMVSAIMLNLTDAASEMPNIFNVLSYGAVGNAIADDTLVELSPFFIIYLFIIIFTERSLIH